MAFLLIFIASILLFSKSKFFPKRWQHLAEITRNNKRWTRTIGYLLLLVSGVLYIKTWDNLTGFVIWSVAVMLSFSIVVMLFPVLTNLLYSKK
ncbi:MAG: DUF3325 family protein [Bacteroidota bacterium]